MLKSALFVIILLALQTSGQYQPQQSYPTYCYPQTEPCVPPHNPLPPCPTYCQPLNPAPNPASYPSNNPANYPANYPTNYPANYPANNPANYPAPYPANNGPLQYMLPIGIPMFYNSKDFHNPAVMGNSERDGQPDKYSPPSQPNSQPNTPQYEPRPTPPNHHPETNKADQPNKNPNESPKQHNNKPTDEHKAPTENNYDHSPESPGRSGRPRLFTTMISRIPEISGSSRSSGVFSNIGAAAGSFADSIFK